jgi:hypothetical protein
VILHNEYATMFMRHQNRLTEEYHQLEQKTLKGKVEKVQAENKKLKKRISHQKKALSALVKRVEKIESKEAKAESILS